MRELRPIVETGYENILLVRLLIEEVQQHDTDAIVAPGTVHRCKASVQVRAAGIALTLLSPFCWVSPNGVSFHYFMVATGFASPKKGIY